MKAINIESILKSIKKVVKSHYIGDGKYANWIWQDEKNPRELGYNAYGCADAANILYTLDDFEKDPVKRRKYVEALQDMQDKETGIFLDATHHDFHTTAHCIAALELFDEKPLYPLTEMKPYTDIKNFIKFHEDIDWLHSARAMHPGPAMYSAFVLTDIVDKKWCDDYFDYLTKNCNSECGMWSEGDTEKYSVYLQMATAFHFLFTYEHAKKAFPYPEKLIDSCLDMYRNNQVPDSFGKSIQYIEMDWVYCLNRASRQTPHRFYEVKEEIYGFAQKYIKFLESLDWGKDELANNLHSLFGTVCCLAELQNALPGIIESSKPLKLVLDRRPFI